MENPSSKRGIDPRIGEISKGKEEPKIDRSELIWFDHNHNAETQFDVLQRVVGKLMKVSSNATVHAVAKDYKGLVGEFVEVDAIACGHMEWVSSVAVDVVRKTGFHLLTPTPGNS
ncbi:hypothetical protein F3Y22_tig00110788pilonHSYRG00127 [Hibiscus syriacus]|uniref:Uncharacterized protein n=1 Tax=Hibiscus syriacus TaxID=106335 RepID=A0A6A2ZPJ4_HIBSY|nr:hypothetical protein F3Y22_tig00110788pilonHSYRG00127 [Hibiscus syriacus]